MKKIIVIDTSMFCTWLKLPNFETCESRNDTWDFERINEKIETEIRNHSTLVLPLATIIESGNHLSHCSGDIYSLAHKFCDILRKSVEGESPWATFSQQSELWNDACLKRLADEWPPMAASKVSIGDATIKNVAEMYAKIGYDVEILTCDSGLKAYEPTIHTTKPRRRK